MMQDRDGEMRSTSEPLVDIIMTVWNHLDVTKRAVALIREGTIVPYRLIVSDGASTDGTVEWLNAQGDIIAIIPEINEGNLTAWNRGIKISTAPYIAFLNNDVEVPRGWLGLLVEGLDNNPVAGVISANETAGRVSVIPGGEVVVGDSPTGLGGCSVMKRDVVQKIGFWDERFNFAYNGDTDYAYRLRLAGWKFAVHNGVLVHHPGAVTIKGTGEYNAYVARGLRLVHEKYPGVSFRGGAPWEAR